MPYLIDSDWAIDHLNGVPAAILLLRRLALDRMFVSIISYIEIYEGIARSPDPAQAEWKFGQFLVSAPVLPLSQDVAQRCARLRELLRQQGRRTRSRALDLIIAATALEHDLTLVTRNTDDYQDIPGLRLYR
jgi:tRNA(fMet)-specific endonuclease VapC